MGRSFEFEWRERPVVVCAVFGLALAFLALLLLGHTCSVCRPRIWPGARSERWSAR